jgi:sec-independent protein translocase protein TatB
VFDIGFSELLVIGVVALVVIGPEKLPRVARTVGHLMGRAQRYVADVKADIAREAEFDELRRMRDSVQSTAADIEQSVTREFTSLEASVNEALHPEPESRAQGAPETAASIPPGREDGKPS